MQADSETHAAPCHLLVLPPELLVAVCSRLTFPALASLVRSCSALYDVWTIHAERISRAIALSTGLADSQSSGAAQAVVALDAPLLPHPDHLLDPAELRRVVQSQPTMHDDDDEIKSWRDFARSRYLQRANWLAGRARLRHLQLDFRHRPGVPVPIMAGYIWRFKLDCELRYIVATGAHHGTHAFSAHDGRQVWFVDAPASPYAHLEMSNGHFVAATDDPALTLRRRESWGTATASPPPPSGTSPDSEVFYSPAAMLRPGAPCSATKMRWPYFVAVARNSDEVFRFDLRASPPQRTVFLMTPFWQAAPHGLGEGQVRYVEIDSRAIYLAGDKSVVMWRHDEPGDQRICWPPDPPEGPIDDEQLWHALDPSLEFDEAGNRIVDSDERPAERLVRPMGSHYRQPRLGGFGAVHHDGSGTHVVGASGQAGAHPRLFWTTNYLDTVWSEDRAFLERKTVVLTILKVDATVTIDQLAVENGRAVFALQDEELGASLWLVNLRDFADHADFAKDPPKPVSTLLLSRLICRPAL